MYTHEFIKERVQNTKETFQVHFEEEVNNYYWM